jgi:hypothetical protein
MHKYRSSRRGENGSKVSMLRPARTKELGDARPKRAGEAGAWNDHLVFYQFDRPSVARNPCYLVLVNFKEVFKIGIFRVTCPKIPHRDAQTLRGLDANGKTGVKIMGQKVFLKREQKVCDYTEIPQFYFDNKWRIEWSDDIDMYITMPPRPVPPAPQP